MIASKLARPRLRSGVLDRPRVTALLEREGDVTLVSAPAGYGKTIAVGSWLRDAPAGWVSLDEADNDPVRLWTYAAAAVGEQLPPGELEPSIEALAARKVPLVLDDVHVLTDERCLATLDHATRVFERLVLISRADPPLRLARLRAEGALNEVRTNALAFTAAEAAAVLGVSDARAITTRTEGWPAAIYLVALWRRDGRDPRTLPAKHLSEYLASEVLAGLDPDLRDFLVRTSVLPRLSAPLCDHVLERDDSAARLAELVNANLFLVALDAGWFRYHDLFRALLRRELDDAAPLHRRAAAWFLERDQFEEAAEHAHAAGDHRMVAELVDAHFLALLRVGREATLLRWLADVPDRELDARPRVLVGAALAAGSRMRPRVDVQRLLAAAERGRDLRPDAWTAREEAALQIVHSGVRDDDVPRTVDAALRAIATGDDEYEVIAYASLAFARLLAGDDADAERAAQTAITHPAAAGRPHGLTFAFTVLAILRADAGRVAAAREFADRALDVARASGTTGGLGHVRARAADAIVARREGRLAHAASAAERALAALVPGAFAARVRLELALVRAERGELARAESELDRARQVLAECRDPGAVAARVEQVEAALTSGPTPATEPLSPAERAVLDQLVTPRSYAQIANALILSPNTVKTHVRAIYGKLGVHSRQEALARATALGLLDDSPEPT